MIHELRLNKGPYNSIKAGTKTVEMRLYDEKRQQIKVGDYILFKERDNEQNQLKVLVKTLDVYNNFNELYKHYDKVSLGYSLDEDAKPEDMTQYYPIEEQAMFGVVAIGIELV